MADDAKSTPATETASVAAAPSPKAPKLGPIAQILADLDARLKTIREEQDRVGKVKADVQKAIQFAKQEKMGEPATVAIVEGVLAKSDLAEKPKGKGGRPKGSKSKGKNVGGRGKRISAAKIAKIQALSKKGVSNNAIAKKIGTTPKTVANYVK